MCSFIRSIISQFGSVPPLAMDLHHIHQGPELCASPLKPPPVVLSARHQHYVLASRCSPLAYFLAYAHARQVCCNPKANRLQLSLFRLLKCMAMKTGGHAENIYSIAYFPIISHSYLW